VTTEPREQHEPSMEEILSSIRRIIADEEADDASHDDDDLGAAEAQSEALNKDADALARAAEDGESDDVLELTRVVRESGEVVDLRAEGAAAAEPSADMEASEVEMAPLEDASDHNPRASFYHPPKQEDLAAVQTNPADARAELVSATAASAATGAFAKLSQAFQRTPAEESIADDSGRSVEQFIEDMIRPLLKDWLDQNLQPIVERLVQKEIQKIARRAELM
jgi:cell pole-organizing protein PopZ